MRSLIQVGVFYPLLVIALGLFLGCKDSDDESITDDETVDGSESGGSNDDDDGDSDGQSVSLTVTYPTLARTVYVDDETAARTVSFTYTGDRVECSRDGGLNYTECDDDSYLVWTADNINDSHVIRVVSEDGDTASESFTPSSKFSSIEILTCTKSLSGSMDFDTFDSSADLSTSGQVICLDDGTAVTKDGDDTVTTLLYTADDIAIVAREGDTVTFTNGTDEIFDSQGYSDLRFIGLTLDVTGNDAYYIRWMGGRQSHNVDIWYNDVTATGSPAYCVLTNSTVGTTAEPIHIKGSTMTHDGSFSGNCISAVGATMTIEDSTISSGYQPVNVYYDSEVTISNSTITSTKDSNSTSIGGIYIYRDATVHLSDSVVETSGVPAVTIGQIGSATGASILNTDNSTFKRLNVANADSAVFYIDTSDGATVENEVNSTDNGNLFCNVSHGTANANFDEVVDSGGQVNSGNLSVAAQTNGGAIGACP